MTPSFPRTGVSGLAGGIHIVEGAHAIAVGLARELGDSVRLGDPVRSIEWAEDEAAVSTADLRARAERVIVAISPAMRSRIRFFPQLPTPWSEVPHRWFQGPVSKVYAFYDEPFWRTDGSSGAGLSDSGPISVTLDAGHDTNGHGVLLGFVAGGDARAWDTLPADERRAQALSSFADLFGSRALNPTHYVDHAWSAEPWAGGGSVSAAAPGAWTTVGRGIAEPMGPIHWAGTETAGIWTGFMEGAVRSGLRAVAEITHVARTDHLSPA